MSNNPQDKLQKPAQVQNSEECVLSVGEMAEIAFGILRIPFLLLGLLAYLGWMVMAPAVCLATLPLLFTYCLLASPFYLLARFCMSLDSEKAGYVFFPAVYVVYLWIRYWEFFSKCLTAEAKFDDGY